MSKVIIRPKAKAEPPPTQFASGGTVPQVELKIFVDEISDADRERMRLLFDYLARDAWSEPWDHDPYYERARRRRYW